MGRIANTFQLAKLSWGVLSKDRELLALPILSFVCSMVLVAPLIFAGITWMGLTGSSVDNETYNPALILLLIVASIVLTIIGVFFNGALVAGAHERLTGGDPTIGSAIRKAFSRIPGLVPWALLTATVGMILRAISERAGWLGKIIVGAIGFAWEVVTFLVVPAIIIDDKGAWDGVKSSGALLKQTWGENIVAKVGFWLLAFLAILPAFVLVGLFAAIGGGIGAIVGGAILILWVVVVVVVISALSAVFQTALYLYATTGMAPTGFENSGIAESFRSRSGPGLRLPGAPPTVGMN